MTTVQSARSASIIFRSEERPGQFSFLFGKFLQIVLVGVPQNILTVAVLHHLEVDKQIDTSPSRLSSSGWTKFLDRVAFLKTVSISSSYLPSKRSKMYFKKISPSTPPS